MKKILKLSCIIILLILITGCGEKEYYCHNGDTLKGTSCVSKNYSPASPVYTCRYQAGTYLVGDQCCYRSSNICLYAKVDSYICSSGYLDGDKCITETTYNAYVR